MNSRLTSRYAAAVAAALVVASSARPAAQQYRQTDIDNGAKLYGGQCATCHGPNGDSIGGVDVGSNKFRRATSDEDVMNVIDRKSTRLNSSHIQKSRMPSSA